MEWKPASDLGAHYRKALKGETNPMTEEQKARVDAIRSGQTEAERQVAEAQGDVDAAREKVYIDAELAARCFWAGYQASEQGLDGRERTQAFLGAVQYTYPEVQKHEHLIPIESTLVRIAEERKRQS